MKFMGKTQVPESEWPNGKPNRKPNGKPKKQQK